MLYFQKKYANINGGDVQRKNVVKYKQMGKARI